MKGYKLTNHDMTCLDYQYELGKKYINNELIEICRNGFHFCEKAFDCTNYYDFLDEYNKETRLFEIEAEDIIKKNDNKSVCSEITFVREIIGEEKFELLNKGIGNIGYGNIGNYNIGNNNQGNNNQGNENKGNNNIGNYNQGNFNIGDNNKGDNRGNSNRGYNNIGDNNQCNYNMGKYR